MTADPTTRRRKRRSTPPRATHYTQLRHPFSPQALFCDDRIADLHDAALRLLEEAGMAILLDEAIDLFAAAGAVVDGDIVRIGREIVEAALRTAPGNIHLRAQDPSRDLHYAPGSLLFGPAGGCPNATDRLRGRRPGNLAGYEDALKLQQTFDVIHILGPSVEPQDVPVSMRHYALTERQIALGNKTPFVYARGRGQVAEALEMLRLSQGLSEDGMRVDPRCYTVINTNSPRMLDRPMAQGIIDFARAGQLSIITPFCLAGAMAPVTVAGALVLQHAEALAGITLAQLARPGAPVSYGGFSSNVDMKSGSPAFGTPEHVQLQLGSGQLARHIGLPWRSAAGSASNVADMQSGTENTMGLWGALMANATITFHAAGWLEGGLTFGYEKFINDVEALQRLAELCGVPASDAEAIGFDDLASVQPGGHFFDSPHTMARYSTAFYAPLNAELQNFGTWDAAGALDATVRATAIWQDVLDRFVPPPGAEERAARVADFVARGRERGGVMPLE